MTFLDPVLFIIWGLVAICGYLALRKGREHAVRGVRRGGEMFLVNGPRIVMALLSAGFISTLLPKDLIAAWLGHEAGLRGILIGCAIGPLFPGGPLVVYPILIALLKAGAGFPAIVAVLTSAATWGLHRIIAFEIPMMGPRFAYVRFLSCCFMPPTAGLLAALAVEFLGPPVLGH